MPVALLITVIGRVIIQLGRLTDWSVNELTRRGPVRELERPGRTRRVGAVATSAATAGARAGGIDRPPGQARPHTTPPPQPVIGREIYYRNTTHC